MIRFVQMSEIEVFKIAPCAILNRQTVRIRTVFFIFDAKKELNLQQNTEKYAKQQVGTFIAITFQRQIFELHKIFQKEKEK